MSGIHAMLLVGGGGSGGGSGSVTLNNVSVEDQNTGANSSAGWRIDSDGLTYQIYQGVDSADYAWTSDPVANYEVRATKTAGSNPTGSSLATWLSCASDQTWTVTDTTANDIVVYSYLTIEVRDAATLEVKASCSVNLIAERL